MTTWDKLLDLVKSEEKLQQLENTGAQGTTPHTPDIFADVDNLNNLNVKLGDTGDVVTVQLGQYIPVSFQPLTLMSDVSASTILSTIDSLPIKED